MTDNERINTADQKDNAEERTFTQAEVDEIVRKRLAREKKRTESADQGSGDDRARTLEERELHIMAREKLLDEGMPSQLADVLRYSDEESLIEALEVIKNLNLDKEAPKAWGERLGKRANNITEDVQIRGAMGLNRK